MSEMNVEMVMDTCIDCGIIFAVTERFRKQRQRDHKNLHCPNGHAQCYLGETDLEKERTARKTAEADAERYNRWNAQYRSTILTGNRSRAALMGQITRLKKRIVQGCCPFCGVVTYRLRGHLQADHPKLWEKYGVKE